MKTLFAILFLLISGIIANFTILFILNIAGLPGALVARKAGKFQFILGSIVSAMGQSFIYLGYTAFIVNWTLLATKIQKINILIWLIAFFAVILPILLNVTRAKVEAQEDGYITNAQIEGLYITLFLTFFGFFTFAFIPSIMQLVYNWIPYISS